MTEDNHSLSEMWNAVYRTARFRPLLAVLIVVLSFVAAVLEGLGLSFLIPILDLARNDATATGGNRILELFARGYDFAGIPFTLETVLVGVSIVMTLRYGSSFLVSWFRTSLNSHYVKQLQITAFDRSLGARIRYFDSQGSDDILNTIVTESKYAGRVIRHLTRFLEQGLLSLMYLSIALYLAPVLTVAAVIVLGGISVIFRFVIESGSTVGDRVAEANEKIQETAQAGLQGIYEIKLFRMQNEVFPEFRSHATTKADSEVRLSRNQAAMSKLYELFTALTVFVMIYAALTLAAMPISTLAVFLFSMFRLAPRASTLNNIFYKIEADVPHLIRTQGFVDGLVNIQEPASGSRPVPDSVETIVFDDVSFSYETGEEIFDGLSFRIDRREFAAFVGPSGAGKSTIASLLTRLYEPDDGTIRANGIPIDELDVDTWRSRVSIVRQNPFLFNDTLRANLTIGNRDAPEAEIERVCQIAQVTEFLDDLPNGYETVLGEQGVRLSGGQRQRVALARALLKDADLLVLDEATSDLDSNIEQEVHDAIESMDRDYAIFVIAHRLSTVINADCIYVLDDGEIVEAAPHEELIAKDGRYADLYSTQSRT